MKFHYHRSHTTMKKLKPVLQLFLIVYTLTVLRRIIATDNRTNYQQYEGYKTYNIFLDNEKQYLVFRQDFGNSIEILRRGNLQPMSILLHSQIEPKIEEFLRDNNLKYDKINDNVAASARSDIGYHRFTRSASNDNFITFDRYQRFDVINDYLDNLSKQYPQQVQIMNLGKSYEGRALKAVLITTVGGNISMNSTKPVILIDAGVHAREWISHATAVYIIHQLVQNATSYQKELEMFDWLVWPVVNPDGYEYSHVSDRYWRKTRQPSENLQCKGVDLNRNFDYKWALVDSSYDPCDDTYHGPKPFSEPEAVALRDLLLSVNSSCLMYLTLHSYGNYLLYPWGYTNAVPSTWPYLDSVARAGANAIKKETGTTYTVGGSARALYPASGASDDFAFAKANIPIVLCMELPSGGNDFDPPQHKILPIAQESWLGIRAMAWEALANPLRNIGSPTMVGSHLVLFVMLKTYIVLLI